jgi:cytochrome c553
MKQAILSAGIISIFAFCITAYAAGDIQAGKAKAVACVGCHGATGDGVAPNPPLANRTEEEIVQALKDYNRVNASTPR